MENEINLIEFVVEDDVANAKSEKIIKRVGMENQFGYEDFYNYCRRENNFFKCAKKMELFQDNSKIGQYAPFMGRYSRYQHMDRDQMKSYFVWRTKVRDGFIEQIDASYLFVYIYELIHLVGVNSAEEGFSKLMFLWENAVEFEPRLTIYLQDWMVDFVEYYNLPLNHLEHPMLKTREVGREGDTQMS
jgi:hypothetical protein